MINDDGEVVDWSWETANEPEAEAVYAEQTEGVSAPDAATVATVMAEEAHEEAQMATEPGALPIEEQNSATHMVSESKATG